MTTRELNRRAVSFRGVGSDKNGGVSRSGPRRGSVINDSTFQWSVVDGFAGVKKNVFNPSEDTGGEEHRTLISRQWYYALPTVISFYLIAQFGIISPQPYICHGDNGFSPWVGYVKVAVAACFLLTACNHFCVVFFMGSWERRDLEHPRGVYAAAATVSLIAGISTVVTITSGDKTVCTDALGVETYQAQWAEWLATVPFLAYVTIAIEDKSKLLPRDIAIVASMFFTIFTGFIMNFTQKRNTTSSGGSTSTSIDAVSTFGFCMFAFSCVCMMGVYFMMEKIVSGSNAVKPLTSGMAAAAGDSSTASATTSWKNERKAMKTRLSRLLFLVMPLFPLVYVLRWTHVISRDEFVVGNLVVGMIAKLVFVSILSLESILVQLSLERKANESRRQFLRYVFHEVRVPLNTMTMGISVLKDSNQDDMCSVSDHNQQAVGAAGPSPNDEILAMMSNAANFMNETLNDVLSISNIEDGIMNLVMQPFKLNGIINDAVNVVKGRAASKHARIIVDGMANSKSLARASTLIGDRFRLEQVLVNLLSQAMLASPANGDVKIQVSAKEVWCIDCPEEAPEDLLSGSPQNGSRRRKSAFQKSGFMSQLLSKSPKRAAMRLFHQSMRRATSVARGSVVAPIIVPLTKLSNMIAPQNENNANVSDSRGVRKIEVTVKVFDRGIGLSAERQRKMFTPFAEIRPHELQDGAGSGLGLVLAKEIVAMHGGTIFSESGTERGNMCGFTIPFDVVEDALLSPEMMLSSSEGSLNNYGCDVLGATSARLNRVAISMNDFRRFGDSAKSLDASAVVQRDANSSGGYYQSLGFEIGAGGKLVASSHSSASSGAHSRSNSVKKFSTSLSNYFARKQSITGQRKGSDGGGGGVSRGGGGGGGLDDSLHPSRGGFLGGGDYSNDEFAAARSPQSVNNNVNYDHRGSVDPVGYGGRHSYHENEAGASSITPILSLNMHNNPTSVPSTAISMSVSPSQLLNAGAYQLNMPSMRRAGSKHMNDSSHPQGGGDSERSKDFFSVAPLSSENLSNMSSAVAFSDSATAAGSRSNTAAPQRSADGPIVTVPDSNPLRRLISQRQSLRTSQVPSCGVIREQSCDERSSVVRDVDSVVSSTNIVDSDHPSPQSSIDDVKKLLDRKTSASASASNEGGSSSGRALRGSLLMEHTKIINIGAEATVTVTATSKAPPVELPENRIFLPIDDNSDPGAVGQPDGMVVKFKMDGMMSNDANAKQSGKTNSTNIDAASAIPSRSSVSTLKLAEDKEGLHLGSFMIPQSPQESSCRGLASASLGTSSDCWNNPSSTSSRRLEGSRVSFQFPVVVAEGEGEKTGTLAGTMTWAETGAEPGEGAVGSSSGTVAKGFDSGTGSGSGGESSRGPLGVAKIVRDETKDDEDRLGQLINDSNNGRTATMMELQVSAAAAIASASASSRMQSARTSSANTPAASRRNSLHERMKFLLVDDTMSNNKMLKMLLSKRGISSDQAFNGQEGIDTVQKNGVSAYDLIFMDYTMPIKNGAEATAGIRALGFTGLIIGLTGNALDDDVQRFLKAGVDCVIPKPFRDEQLSKILHIIAHYGSTSNEETKLALLRKLASASSAVSGMHSPHTASTRDLHLPGGVSHGGTNSSGNSLHGSVLKLDRRSNGDNKIPSPKTAAAATAALINGDADTLV